MFGRRESFIGVYDHTLSKQECERAIELFETSPQRRGTLYGDGGKTVVQDYIKSDIEMIGTQFGDGTEVSDIIEKGLKTGLEQYHQKHHFALEHIEHWGVDSHYNFQKYENPHDGFKQWHTEQGGAITSKRILAWMIYLNNAKSGTDFLYYPTTKAKTGRCVIWPASWTHTHRSQSNKGLKYIATGWISYLGYDS